MDSGKPQYFHHLFCSPTPICALSSHIQTELPSHNSNKHIVNVLNLHAARWHTKYSIILIFSMITFHVPICTTASVQPTFCTTEMQFLFTDGINLVGIYPQWPPVYITYNDLWSTARSTWKEFCIDHMRRRSPVVGQTPTTRRTDNTIAQREARTDKQ